MPQPVEVQAFCSHVVWRNSPNISCDIINGYDVRLVNPTTNQSVIRRVDASSTFYHLHQIDDAPLKTDSTNVQVDLSRWHAYV